MKLMKKTLSVVLVAAMILSMIVAAGAVQVEYTDAQDITYVEAVDVISVLGIVQGYEDGSFLPDKEVTRAEFAKLVATMLNKGKPVSDSYAAAALKFTDAKNHWAKNYIGYCVTAGLLNGKTATTFKPDANVTAAEAAKILLCTLGYDANVCGFTGPSWKGNAMGIAQKTEIRLFENMDATKADKAISREEACLMMLNTLQCTMVECKNRQGKVGDITVTLETYFDDVYNYDFDYKGREDNITMQLCEKLFPSLRLSPLGSDNFGRPASSWSYNGADLGVYPSSKQALNICDGVVTGYQMKKIMGDRPINSLTLSYNGRVISDDDMDDVREILAEKMDDESVRTLGDDATRSYVCAHMRDLNEATAFIQTTLNLPEEHHAAALMFQIWSGFNNSLRGTAGVYYCSTAFHSEFYYDEETCHIHLVSQQALPARVINKVAATYDAQGNELTPTYYIAKFMSHVYHCAPFELAPGNMVTPPEGAVIFTDKYDANNGMYLGVDDIVIVRLGYSDELEGYVPDNAQTLNVINATITSVSNSNGGARTESFKCKCTDNTMSSNQTNPSWVSTYTAVEVGKVYNVYYARLKGMTGMNNYAFHVEEGGSTPSIGIYYVLNASAIKDEFGVKGYAAQLLDSSGHTSVVDTTRDYSNLVDSLVTMTAVGTKQEFKRVGNSGNGLVTITAKDPNVVLTPYTLGVKGQGQTILADEKTAFVVEEYDDEESSTIGYYAYNGIKNVPNSVGTYYAYYMLNGRAVVIFAMGATRATISEDYGVLFKNPQKDAATVVAEGEYVEVLAMIRDHSTTLKVTKDLYDKTLLNGFNLYNGYTTDENGWINRITKVRPAGFFTEMQPLHNGLITIGDEATGMKFAYHKNILTYVYSVSRHTLTFCDAADLEGTLDARYQSAYTVNEATEGKPLAALCVAVP